ncbi:ABC transporter ATP-binding protein [Pseudogracilibacillus auburnensis]|uniref:ABC-2 type transport system ATP-binding protein n=1 Tax=Pseudogracilibacillus auburnensis TaxID=1494959 RepID=A0A2V3VZL4_9BACI|nr:ABC transporter ATP-binding protein [Pseudogracilibacillus auburnensis]PXW87006.1 ABC-2 type transport system ATP-binding protein [Pseudogracilibacillus auburnensis]
MSLLLKNVTKKFDDHIAVNNLTLEMPERELFGFLGGNGAGKTTTFRMILGLLDQTDGQIEWNGEKIDYHKSHLIGYLPEERGLYPKLKVKEQLVYLGKLRGMTGQSALIELKKWLDRFQVSHYLDKKVEELSKGNQQKIQFISSVMHKPKLLILDEPFSGLDPINVEMLKEAVIDVKNSGTSIVFSSHQMDHVEELCENLCILKEGNAVVKGNLSEIKRSFGKKNLIIHAQESLDFLQQMEGVVKFKQVIGGCELQIMSEEVSQIIFNELQGKGFIRKFELEEPTLNDIFIEKVGEHYE